MATDQRSEYYPEDLDNKEEEIKQLREEIAHLRSSQQASLQAQEKHKKLEEKYQHSQLRFKTVFEQSLLGNKILTSDLALRQVNMALVTMLGYSRKEDILGTRILDYAHPDFKQHWHELQDQLWKKNIPNIRMETCLVRKNGTSMWVNVSSILFGEGEETLGYTILEDITARKELEQKAKGMYEAQELMVHMVSHDLKNPIHIIRSLATMLQKEVEQGMTPHNREKSLNYLSLQVESCQKAYTILKDLLLIGELETEMMLARQPIDIKSFIEAALESIRFKASQKSIRIDFRYPPDILFVPLQAARFSLVLDNLLSNALKFSNPQSIITLELSRQEQKARLRVQDEGIGIPEHLQSSVFNKFTKANRSGTQGEETTGLGLFIVKRIIHLHQGKIWLESQPGQGTTFYIDLPLKVEE